MTETENPREAWTVYDPVRENTKHFDSKTLAEDTAEQAKADLQMQVEIYPPGELPGDEDANKTDSEMVRCQCLDKRNCGRAFIAWPSEARYCPYCRELATIVNPNHPAVPEDAPSLE
jgi:hypothetical protein